MDWVRYKAICDRPDVMSRWMISETAALVDGPLRTRLLAALTELPLPKPADHKGDARTDMFEVTLADAAATIARAVEQAEAGGAKTTTGSRLAGLVAAWRELAEA